VVDWTAVLGAVALVSVVGEVISAFFIEVPVAALVVAALFLVGWFLLRRGGIAGVVLIGLLCLIELLGLAFYEREDADDWVLQILFFGLGAVGVVAAIGTLRGRSPQTV
jgi:hypothetical protein